jgi:hypothetical protein
MGQRTRILDERQGVRPRIRARDPESPAASAGRLHDREARRILADRYLAHVLLQQERRRLRERSGLHALPPFEAPALPFGRPALVTVERLGSVRGENPAEHLGHEPDEPIVDRHVLIALLSLKEL